MTITWNPVAGAISYKLYMNTVSNISLTNPANMHHPSVNSPFVHPGLINGTTYFFVVTAVNVNGESIESSEVSAIPQALPLPLPLPVVTLTARPSFIVSGQTSTISWASTNSASCISTGGGGTGMVGTFTTPPLTDTTTYTVTCMADGLSASKSKSADFTVTVLAVITTPIPPPTNAFSSVGSCVLDSVTGLMWEVKTADGDLRDWNNTYTNYDSTTAAQKYNPNTGISSNPT